MKIMLLSVSKDDMWSLECLLRSAADELNIPLEIVHSTDLDLILGYEAKSIPFMVFNQKVFFDDGLPTKSMVIDFLKSNNKVAL